ncbi:hypothetical protein B4168_1537 [Anoxybacillus flavithermus]|nr:hypothetical protein B4168_1537 [Anoxybacillus flavithermus]OAO84192.1 hypothetical protein GT23_3727 [Parageobacillus thermoglucosidasius]
MEQTCFLSTKLVDFSSFFLPLFIFIIGYERGIFLLWQSCISS